MRRYGTRWPLALALAMVVGGCSGPAASVSPGPTASPAAASPTAPPPSVLPTLLPSSSPIPSATVEPGPTASTDQYVPELAYVNRFVMRVAVSELSVRQKPSQTGISNGKAPRDGLFMVYDWPVIADGYTWYFGFTLLTSTPGVLPDLPTPIETGYDEVLAGWMASGTEDSPFLIPVAPRCPDTVDLANVTGMLGSERINCFGSDTIELRGAFGCGGCGGTAGGKFEPAWLASVLEFDYLAVGEVGTGTFALHFPPDGPAKPAEGTIIKVRGHFSDERSATCRITELAEDGNLTVEVDNAAAEQWCRSKFVVESFVVN